MTVTGWHQGPLLAIDFESTGVDPTTAVPVTVALVRVQPLHVPDIHSWLVDPGVDIPEGATAVHGITTEQARDEGADLAETLDLVASQLAFWMAAEDVPLIAYNASYDVTLLEHTLHRLGQRTLASRLGAAVGPVLDPYVIDKHVDKFRKGSRKLVDTARHYGVTLTAEDAHGAEADALAAARVAWCIARDYPEIAALGPRVLHDAQVGWAAEQAASLQAYFRRQPGREDETVDGTWPVRPLPVSVAS